jgi:hypothetical protein
MWAAVVSVDISDVDAALEELHERVVPGVRQAPGFVSGCWIRLDEHHGTSFVVFEEEDQARAGAPVERTEMSGVTVSSVRFGEVVARA